MIPAFVQQLGTNNNKTAGTTLAVSTTAASTASNLIVARVLFDNFTTASKPIVSSISKPGGETNSWVFLGAARSTSTSGGAFASGEMWCIQTTVAWPTSTSVTVTLDSSVTQKAMTLAEFSGTQAVVSATVGTAYSTTTTAASAITGAGPSINDLALGFIFGSNVATAMAGDNDTDGGSWSAPVGFGTTGGSAATNNFGIGQYKVLTAASQQTLNNQAAMTAGNGAIVATLRPIPDPVVVQAAYQFYADGTETGSAALASQDTAPTVNVDSGDANLQLRVRLQETAGNSSFATDDWQLQWTSGEWSADVLCDEYGDANWVQNNQFGILKALGQSFLGNGQSLTRAGFRLGRTGTATNATIVWAELYAHTGTFGSTGKATGSPLAISNSIPVSSLPVGSSSWFDFDFDGAVTLTNGTPYVIYAKVDRTSGTNVLTAGADTSPAHAGTGQNIDSADGFAALSADYLFRVYTSPTPSAWADVANVTIDSYTNTASATLGAYDATVLAAGQSFTGTGKPLTRASIRLSKLGTPPASTVTAKVYAHTGTFGNNGLGTGTALATSTTSRDISTIGGNAWYDFAFDGSFTPTNGTNYVVVAEVSAVGAVSNCLSIAYQQSGTHGGNRSKRDTGGTWTAGSFVTEDALFILYSASTVVCPHDSTNLTDAAATTNRLTGGTGSFVAGKLSEDGLVDDLGWSGSNYTEVLYAITVKKADVSNGDTLRFRVLRNGAITTMVYTATPTINVTKTPIAVTQAAYRFYPDAIEAGATVAISNDNLAGATNNGWTNITTTVGQSFLGDGKPVMRGQLRLRNAGTPPGNLTGYIYAQTGTFGTTTDVPTGSPLATSTNTIAASSLTTTSAFYDFDFDGTFTLTNGTAYFFVVATSVAGDGSNFVYETTNGSVAAGQRSRFTSGAWNSSSSSDCMFRIWTATALAAQDTAPTVDVTAGDVNLQLRTRLQLTTAAPTDSADDWQLQWEKNASGTWSNASASESLVDSYTVTAGSTQYFSSAADRPLAQSFTGQGRRLSKASFYVDKDATPPGNVTAVIYAHTGTYGTSSVPTGPALATSTAVAATALSASGDWQDFTFDGTFTMVNGTPYCLAFVPDGALDATNKLAVWRNNVDPVHGGNSSAYSGAWTAIASHDFLFRLYAAASTAVPYDSANLTDGAATTNRLGAGSGSFVAGKVSEDGSVDDLGWSGNNYTEVLHSLTLKKADLANGDTLRFRILRNGGTTDMTYTVTPTVNVTKTGALGRPKVYVSGAFTTKPLKVWSGSAWVEKPVKVWTGSAWKTLT